MEPSLTVQTRSQRTSKLTRHALLRAVSELSRCDDDLATVVRRFGPPPMWSRGPGFATLVRIMLEQQVSLASAAAAYERLKCAVGRVTAERVAGFSVLQLQDHGLTRQKAGYCHNLAQLTLTGGLDLRGIQHADDATARRALLKVQGIGPWSADIYLLMALGRPDVWPDGDLALAEAARQVKRLRARPTGDQLRRLAATWRPWRSVAARILWHHYLCNRRTMPPAT